MWPGLLQLKQRPLQGSFFTGLVQSRSIGWGAGGTVVVEGLEKEVDAVVVEVTTGGGQNKDGLVVVAFSWVSQNHLHWLSSREVLCFHSAQVVGIGFSRYMISWRQGQITCSNRSTRPMSASPDMCLW